MAPKALQELKRVTIELDEHPQTKTNNVMTILAALDDAPSQEIILEAVRSLRIYFLGALERKDLVPPGSAAAAAAPHESGPLAIFRQWIAKQYSNFVARLLNMVRGPASPAAQVSCLNALMDLLRSESLGRLNNDLLERVLRSVVSSGSPCPEVLGVLTSKYLPHADVRYHALKAIERMCSSLAAGPGPKSGPDQEKLAPGAKSERVRGLFDLLSAVPLEGPREGEGMTSWCEAESMGTLKAAKSTDEGSRRRKKQKREAQQAGSDGEGDAGPSGPSGGPVISAKWAAPKAHLKAYSAAWLAFLGLDLPEDIYRRVLTRVHSHVIPNMANPSLLSDFLTRSLDQGGLVGILALHGIFLLVTKHGLEYPRFYDRLYSLTRSDALYSRHRAQFFRLSAIFLASPMVPAYSAAAFAKRFARMALRAPPAGALLCLAFVHNLVRRHPACFQLLHRDADRAAALAGKEDPYDEAALDPSAARALESSLWEVASLKKHYHWQVAQTAATLLEKDLSDKAKTADMDVEPLAAASVSGMASQENARRLKDVAVAFYPRPPSHLFDLNCGADFAGVDLGLPPPADKGTTAGVVGAVGNGH